MEESKQEQEECMERDKLRALICPLCKFYMAPPIQQCIIGHNFCKECFEMINQCTRCYCPKGNTRNLLLEKLYYQVNLPCKYAKNGCEFKEKGEILRYHEEHCTYTLRKCPFNFTSMCSWKGVIYNIEDHCDDLHTCNVYKGTEIPKTFFNFYQCYDGYNMFLIFAYDAIFRFTSCIDNVTKTIKFATNYLGEPVEDNRYIYETKFLRQDTDRPAIALKSACAYLADHTKPFVGQNFMEMPLDVLKPFCDFHGDLHYVIKIFDNSAALSQPSTSKEIQ